MSTRASCRRRRTTESHFSKVATAAHQLCPEVEEVVLIRSSAVRQHDEPGEARSALRGVQ